jgi:hypothetical protein
MKCDVIAQGVINAAKQLNLTLPVIVRLQVFPCSSTAITYVFIRCIICCLMWSLHPTHFAKCFVMRLLQGTNVENANKLLAGASRHSTADVKRRRPSLTARRPSPAHSSNYRPPHHHTFRERPEAFARQGSGRRSQASRGRSVSSLCQIYQLPWLYIRAFESLVGACSNEELSVALWCRRGDLFRIKLQMLRGSHRMFHASIC